MITWSTAPPCTHPRSKYLTSFRPKDFLTTSACSHCSRDDTGLKTSYPVPSAGPTSELFVLKMTEEFSRNERVPARQDIAKRAFYCHDGRVLIHYHYEDGAITRATKTIVQSRAQSLATSSATSASQDEVQQASIHERACWAQVKTMCAQMLQFAKLRRTAESHVLLEKNVFETARERVEKSGHSRVVDEKTKTVSALRKTHRGNTFETVLTVVGWGGAGECTGAGLPHSFHPQCG